MILLKYILTMLLQLPSQFYFPCKWLPSHVCSCDPFEASQPWWIDFIKASQPMVLWYLHRILLKPPNCQDQKLDSFYQVDAESVNFFCASQLWRDQLVPTTCRAIQESEFVVPNGGAALSSHEGRRNFTDVQETAQWLGGCEIPAAILQALTAGCFSPFLCLCCCTGGTVSATSSNTIIIIIIILIIIIIKY